MPNQKGITMIESIIAIFICAIISIGIFQGIYSAFNTWKQYHYQIEGFGSLHTISPYLGSHLVESKKIKQVSLLSDFQGYLQYEDEENTVVTIFHNNTQNQIKFAQINTLMTNALVATFTKNGITSNVELLMPNVTSFNVIAFITNPDSSRLFRQINVTSIFNLTAINSVKLYIQRLIDGKIIHYDQLLTLGSTRIEDENEMVMGNEDNPFGDFTFPEYVSYVIQNVLSMSELGSQDDAIYLVPDQHTIRIQNRSLYFDTISDAMEAAVSGDIILVAPSQSEEGYFDAIQIKPGVTVKGGYEPLHWTRNLDQNPTKVNTNGSLYIFAMGENTILDGFVLESSASIYPAVVAQNIQNFKLINCKIQNAALAIKVNNASGQILNNHVIGTEYSVYVQNPTPGLPLKIYRNIFQSLGDFNIYFENTSEVDIRNNLLKGSNEISAWFANCKINMAFINNVVTKSKKIGVYFNNSDIRFYNNIICNNRGTSVVIYDYPTSIYSGNDGNNYFMNNDINYVVYKGTRDFFGPTVDWESSANPYFPGILSDNYETDNQNLIDKGSNVGPIPDLMDPLNPYQADYPSKGDGRLDLGLYGGSQAGRVGLPVMCILDPTMSNMDLKLKISQSMPGDFLIFTTGTYVISETLYFKASQMAYGYGPDKTIISNQNSNYPLINLRGGSIENFHISGNGGVGFYIQSNKEQNFLGNVISGASTGIYCQGGNNVLIKYNSFYRNDKDLTSYTGSTVNLGYNIFSSTTSVAINNQSGNMINGVGNLFHKCAQESNGSYDSTYDITFPNSKILFWDETQSLFHVASASAVEVRNNPDAITPGAFEYQFLQGTVEFPTLYSTLKRQYKSFVLKFENINPLYNHLSTVEFTYLVNSIPITIPQVYPIIGNINNTIEVPLPVTVLTNSFQLKIKMTSYVHNYTPTLREITYKW